MGLPELLTTGPLCRAAASTAAGFIHGAKSGARERANKTKVPVFWSLISEVTSYCCLLGGSLEAGHQAPSKLKGGWHWCGHQEAVTAGGGGEGSHPDGVGKVLGMGKFLVPSFAAASLAPRKMPGATFVPCIRGGAPSVLTDRILWPEPRRIPTGETCPAEKPLVAWQHLALTSHSEGRQIPSRRRCAKIGFAARVKLYPGCHLLFETECVSK